MSPTSGIAGTPSRVSHRSRMVVLNVFRADDEQPRGLLLARRDRVAVLVQAFFIRRETVPAARPPFLR